MSRELFEAAFERFAMLVNAPQGSLMLMTHSTQLGPVFTLQINRRAIDGRIHSVPIGTLFSSPTENEPPLQTPDSVG